MASKANRLSSNVLGDFFVDDSCIDCETCRWVAPRTFGEQGGYARVHTQPSTPDEVRRAEMALLACPTASIGTIEKHALTAAQDAFPDPIADGVHHLGYHAESSFGAASYLAVRPRGNLMIDAPRFVKPLVRRIEALGGVATIFLTHQDDVADFAKYRDHFGARVIIHADDAHGLTGVETITGTAPVALDDEALLIPVPGHTRGSTCLLYRDRFLFSGDHAAFDPERGRVYAFRNACWYSWSAQRASMERLLAHRFEHLLPGHGHPCRFAADELHAQLEACVAWMSETRGRVA
jgi:glyoxylase-like metal-dependent hydrolase (beta-lactamase superfamily II)/ferredoxin